MKMQEVILEQSVIDGEETFRTIIKNSHGRKIYFAVIILPTGYIKIADCWYIDRNIGKTGVQRKNSVPHMLKTTLVADECELLEVIQNELDRKFSGVKFVSRKATLRLSENEYVANYLLSDKPHFLIFIKDKVTETTYELETVLKNKTHRTIYTKLLVTKDVCAVIECHYTDRLYKNNTRKVMPHTVYSAKFNFTKADILKFFNAELVCDFTDILLAENTFFRIENISKPICGSI